MAGRISEYIAAGKLNGTELMDLSVVDAGAASGYVTRKVTVDSFINDFPSLYSASGQLSGNRTIDQNGNSCYFSGGDWGVDFGNKGIIYDDLTKKVGFGEGTPLAKIHVKGGVGDNLALFENSIGNDRFIMDEDGKIGTGTNINASISASYGQNHQSSGDSYGFSFSGTNNALSAVYVQPKGSTKWGIYATNQGTYAGDDAVMLYGRGISNLTTKNHGVRGYVRNGSVSCIGVDGAVIGGATVESSLYVAGVRGVSATDKHVNGYGAFFKSSQTAMLYTKDVIGVISEAEENNISNLSTGKVIGALFKTTTSGGGSGLVQHMAINVPATDNDGVTVLGMDTATNDSTLQTSGKISMFNLPTSPAGLAAGDLWNNAGFINII